MVTDSLNKNFIFKSRIWLNLNNSEVENNYEKNTFSQDFLTSICISTFCIIYSIVNIIVTQKIKTNTIEGLNITNYIFLSLNLGSLFTSIIMSKFFKIKIINMASELKKVFTSINFISLNINLFFIFTLIDLTIDYSSTFMFIINFMTLFKIISFVLVIKSFILTLTIIIVLFPLELIIILTFSAWNKNIVVLSFLFTNIVCLFISYCNEFSDKINYYVYNKMRDSLNKEFNSLLYFTGIGEQNKHSMFNIDRSSNIVYINKSAVNLIRKTQDQNYVLEHDWFSNKDRLFDSYSKSHNFLSLLKNNFLENPDGLEIIKKLPIYTKEHVENIMNEIDFVNEELLDLNSNLYNYLIKIQYSKTKNEDQKTKFSFDIFLNCLKIKEEAEAQIINVNTTNNNKTELMDLMGRNNTQSLLKINTKVDKLCQTKVEMKSTFLCTLKLKNYNKTSGVELAVYFSYNSYQVNFYLEDHFSIKQKERTETIKICKSKYLSKIAHEFRNPISNLLEIYSSFSSKIEDFELAYPNLVKGKEYIQDESICDSSDSDESNRSLIEVQTTKKFTSLFMSLKLNTTNSKCMIEIMHQIINDFTFYSTLSEEGSNSPNITISNNKNANAKTSHKENPTKRMIQKPSSNAKLNLFYNEQSNNFLNLLKYCNYKDIVADVVKIFSVKSALDNKPPKITYKLNISENLPDQIEVDKDIFKSMVFNILYHLYKTVTSGIISISIFKDTNSSSSPLSNNKIYFDISVNGLIRPNNQNDNMLHEMDEESSCLRRHSIEFDNSKLDRSTTAAQGFSFENYHIMRINNTSNKPQQNVIIDSFNTKFHYYLSFVYSKKLGANIIFDNKNSKESKITFYLIHSDLHLFAETKEVDNKSIPRDFKCSESQVCKELNLLHQNRRISQKNSSHSCKTKNKNICIPIPSSPKEPKETPRENEVTITHRTDIFQGQMEFNYLELISDKIVEEHCINSLGKSFSLASSKNIIPVNISRDMFRRNSICSHKPLSDPHVSNNYSNLIAKISSKDVVNNSPFIIQNKLSKLKRMSVFVSRASDQYLDIFNISRMKSKQSNSTKVKIKLSNLNSTLNNNSFREKSNLAISEDDNVFRILVCDDESLIRKTINRFFSMLSEENQQMEFDVQHAVDGFECLDLIYKNFKAGKYFDMLIIDETMPFMKGSQVIHLLKSIISEGGLNDITIVSFTSYNTSDKIDYIISQGADFVLSKPIRYEEFKSFFFRSFLQQIEILKNIIR